MGVRRVAYRKKKRQNLFSMALVSLAVVMILIMVIIGGFQIQKKLDVYEQKRQELQAQIDEQEKRTKELEEFEKYTQTKQYMEEVAKDKLGLVYEGEILFKQEE